MSKFRVSQRMKFICEEVLKGKPAADIGTDHGIVPMYLVATQRVPLCIATDVNKGPIIKARDNIFASGLDPSRFRLLIGNGLGVLEPGDASTVIIAGMGGELIRNIIFDAPKVAESVERFVLQPRSKSSVLRRSLLENGYIIVNERLARERGRICQIISVEHKDRSELPAEVFEDELDLFIPPFLYERNDPLLRAYLDQKKLAARIIIDKIKGMEGPVIEEKRDFWQRRIAQIEERELKLRT